MSYMAEASYCDALAEDSRESFLLPKGLRKKREMIKRFFGDIASRYDLFNRLASFGMDTRWRRRAIAILDAKPGTSIMDVCTGTGDIAIDCYRMLKGAGFVMGLDFSAQMLSLAKQKQNEAKAQIYWVQADGEAIPINSSSFDRVSIGFSLRNFTDLPLALSELYRVLKPGGKVVLLEAGFPSNLIIRFLYFAFLFTVLPLFGLVLTGKLWPFVYFARSVKGFLRPGQCVVLLNNCGFCARYIPLSFGLASIYIADKPTDKR